MKLKKILNGEVAVSRTAVAEVIEKRAAKIARNEGISYHAAYQKAAEQGYAAYERASPTLPVAVTKRETITKAEENLNERVRRIMKRDNIDEVTQ